MDLPIKILSHHEGLPLPSYQTAQSVGLDLAAAIDQPIILRPFERIAVPTGLAIQLPHGCEGQVRPRSGCSLRDGLVAILGTIDTDYRGELKVIVQNINPPASFLQKLLQKHDGSITITRGMRIAQLVVMPYVHVCPKEVDELYETSRGKKGFGSTGK
jgi:dUTP pyrophosphatase